MTQTIVIVGAGPSGLFCAYQLLKMGYKVELYDQMAGAGKKFLVAGSGGLNITHSEDLKKFSRRYGIHHHLFLEMLKDFSPEDLRTWCLELDCPTFIGTSGRIFPQKMNAATLLMNWLKALKQYSHFEFHPSHKLIDVHVSKELTFEHDGKRVRIKPDKVVFALGGSSWAQTGSDGKWRAVIEGLGLNVHPFKPMNCGFERPWSEVFKKRIPRGPLKNIIVSIGDHEVKGEIMITPYGLEGGGIYALSGHIRRDIEHLGRAIIKIDLKPEWSLQKVEEKLSLFKAKITIKNHIRKNLGLSENSYQLLREIMGARMSTNPNEIAPMVKSLNVDLFSMRPLDEAISTSGGLCFEELSEDLELLKYPGFFAIGEMLDFEAPTGGYLLQACFSSAFRVARRIDSSPITGS